ncbi:MAG: class F sortase [Candidatus Doudnabacteria bacterium]|nr:class F sortase [Candidatus Doudnabacteria bacterium]
MRNRLLQTRLIVFGFLVAAIAVTGWLFLPNIKIKFTTNYSWSDAAAKEKFLAPARIVIPSIGVDAAVERVGILPNGSMDVPADQDDTAWYSLGPRPGEIGSAVIDGHVDGENNTTAVFANLHNLKPGDQIRVHDGQGGVVTFAVRESRIYAPDADATEIFTSADGIAHLNLITCQGIWDKSAQSYTQRLVVFADKLD